MNFFEQHIEQCTTDLCVSLKQLTIEEQVTALNKVRQALHEAGPFSKEPVDCVQWLPLSGITANDYNPNSVAPPEMRLLELSVKSDGFTQPIVGHLTGGSVEIVDGFHRNRVGRESKTVRTRVHGYLPVSIIQESRSGRPDRIAATIRHNRARGVHVVLPMTEIVADLLRGGWTDEDIAKELGMDADEVLRFKQVKGLPELFKDRTFSRSWE
jgi:ParB-like chromosome segregation protein Spo0J